MKRVFTVRFDRESIGLGAEVVGLLLLFIAALWQANFTDWFDRQYFEVAFDTQQEVGTAILRNQADLAEAILAGDDAAKKYYANRVSEKTWGATHEAKNDRERGQRLQSGQGSAFKTVRAWLAILASLLIIVGKTLVLFHKRKEKARRNQSSNSEHAA